MGQLTLTEDAWDSANLIATFDGATSGPAAMRADSGRYRLTGIFADPSLADWNRFDGQPDAARVGHASVSTWEIGTLRQAQATGTITIKGVVITGKYLNFLMAGGGATLDGGRAAVGVSIFVAGTDRPLPTHTAGTNRTLPIHAADTDKLLVTHSPNHCADRYLKGDQHWAHIDVSQLTGMLVDIEIYDHDAVNNCGFITFDHFYQSSHPRGKLAGTAASPDLQ